MLLDDLLLEDEEHVDLGISCLRTPLDFCTDLSLLYFSNQAEAVEWPLILTDIVINQHLQQYRCHLYLPVGRDHRPIKLHIIAHCQLSLLWLQERLAHSVQCYEDVSSIPLLHW